MKKIFLSILLVLTVLLVTGCGKEIDFSKTDHIICSKVEDKSKETITSTLTFAYDKNEKISNFKVEENIMYKEARSTETVEVTNKAMKLISKALGVGFKSSITENNYYYSFTGDIRTFKLLVKQLNKNYNENDVKGDTKQEAINELSKDGYTCKDFKK